MTPEQRAAMTIAPNPRLVWFINFAIDEITARLHKKDDYDEWLSWAASWKEGRRSPAQCVRVAHECFRHKGWGIDGKGTDPVWHTLGQLAWGAKEACFSTPQSGWLVIRYIADAMVAFGVGFSEDGLPLLQPPTVDIEVHPLPMRKP
jgi:hypothetical protein